MTDAELADLLPPLMGIARRAGAAVMSVYATDFNVATKEDGSPVTRADLEADAIIRAELARLTPQIPLVSEESAAAEEDGADVSDTSDTSNTYWLVDPLDGSKEFIDRNGEFTINIALIEAGEPVLGVVLAPAVGRVGRLFAGARGTGALLEDAQGLRGLRCRTQPAAGACLVSSRSHGDESALAALIAERGWQVAEQVSAGSSLKLCLIAAAEADLYPRLGRTMEWDIAAGHAVLAAAGGTVCALSGEALRYGKPGRENPHFIAQGLS